MQILDLSLFFDYLDKVHQRTMRVARCIPPDKLDDTYREGEFTLVDLVRHIATIERSMFAKTVAGASAPVRGGWEATGGRIRGSAYVRGTIASDSAEIFAGLTPAGLNSKCTTPEGTAITTRKWLRVNGGSMRSIMGARSICI